MSIFSAAGVEVCCDEIIDIIHKKINEVDKLENIIEKSVVVKVLNDLIKECKSIKRSSDWI